MSSNNVITPRLVPLKAWLTSMFGEEAPALATARRWARLGNISPQPTLVGRSYFVDPQAVYVPSSKRPE